MLHIMIMTVTIKNIKLSKPIDLINMSSNIIVHKFENGINFKSLHICIEQNDSETPAKFGAWTDGIDELKSKDLKKSKMVIKVATEDEDNYLNLDSCANEIRQDVDEFYAGAQMCNNDIKPIKFCTYDINGKDLLKNQNEAGSYDNKQAGYEIDVISDSKVEMKLQTYLECSIEKVKQNNAHIKDKIQILNRTLNYIKSKEIFDNINNMKPLRSYPCSACEKCFVYETGLRRHFFMRHGNINNLPRWQTVWTCPECFQVWPRQDAAIRHSRYCCKQYNTDVIREIKTSLLLQCEFCEKVFTCIPRLLRHLKYHTIKYSYECNGCSIVFVSYKSAEQHWLQCPWLKTNYTFSLPKMLLCNACDRKFRNYEQLYNHRYKVSHFMGKYSDNNEDESKLVYQCEICSQWFIETSLLEAHRNQQHPQFDSVINL